MVTWVKTGLVTVKLVFLLATPTSLPTLVSMIHFSFHAHLNNLLFVFTRYIFYDENSGAAFDDLENGLTLSPPSLPKPQPSKRLRTPPLQPSPSQPYHNKKRALKRRKKVIEEGHSATSRTLFEHVQLADIAKVNLDLSALPVAKGGYSARHFIQNPLNLEKEYTVVELTDCLGVTILRWEGR